MIELHLYILFCFLFYIMFCIKELLIKMNYIFFTM
uniref:Uncharacterized protein n=1 Tax=Siphoviridae sp. ct5jB2 TaxID=2825337 RepID=A0A8S5TTV3_9CAUD|nr:MAG TPA: hypothetical protein [Siphoviridae sp. ct5jB2]